MKSYMCRNLRRNHLIYNRLKGPCNQRNQKRRDFVDKMLNLRGIHVFRNTHTHTHEIGEYQVDFFLNTST